jgi:hypothetical protein
MIVVAVDDVGVSVRVPLGRTVEVSSKTAVGFDIFR